jgi:hypothetical protein
MKIIGQDRVILRELARKQMELAYSEQNLQNQQEWRRHHRFEKGRPMIHLELGTFSHEVIPKRLRCESEIGRHIETLIYEQCINFDVFGDDKVVSDYFPIQWNTYFHLFDQQIKKVTAEDGHGSNLGHQFQHVVQDLLHDKAQFKPSTYGVEREKTEQFRAIVDETLGDILPTKMQMGCLYAVPTQKIVHMMGMENLLFAMVDYPDLFKELMNQGAEDYIAYFKWLEKEGLLLPTTANESLGQGTFCYTDELPNKTDGTLKTTEVWGFMDSQETVGISPDMYNELIFPSYEKISKAFGLLSYGCCEPVHSIWEKSLSTLSNLRKVSISPWCDEDYMGEQLRGKKIIYHRKPTPNILGVDHVLNEVRLREHIQKTLKAAQGCQLEFTQRDVYTIHNDEEKAKRYIQIIRDEIEKSW